MTSTGLWLLLLPAFTGGLERQVPQVKAPLGSSPDYRRALGLDLAGRYRDALLFYQARAKESPRAAYHAELTRGLIDAQERLRSFPDAGGALIQLGIDAANKFTALQRETGVNVQIFFMLAEHALLAAERSQPSRADPAICLAGLYADAGDHGRARATIARVQGRTFSIEERYNLACYYHSMGQYTEAIEELAKVMQQDRQKWIRYYQKWIRESDDFWRLRGDPRFERLMQAQTKAEAIR